MVEIFGMQETDVSGCYQLSQQLAWPHRTEDWALALKLGQGLVIKQQQQIIASALYWQWGEQWASIGLVIVAAAYRKQGLGKLLLTTIMQTVGSQSIRLSATKAGEPLYSQLGFKPFGQLTQVQTEYLSKINSDTVASGLQFFNAGISDLASLQTLERDCNGMDRKSLFYELVVKGQVIGARALSGQVVGFAACHRFGRGYVIGPIYATSLSIAKLLIVEHCHQLHGQMVRVDCINQQLENWLITHGFKPVDSSVLMEYPINCSTATSSSNMRQYSLATQAFG